MTHVKNEAGFSLAELLVAITILAVGLLSVAGMQLVAIKANMVSSGISAGSALASGVLEEFMTRDADAVILRTAVPVASPATYWAADREVEGAGIFTATYAVEVDTPVVNISRITVTVTGGRDLNNNEKTVVMRGLKRYVPN